MVAHAKLGQILDYLIQSAANLLILLSHLLDPVVHFVVDLAGNTLNLILDLPQLRELLVVVLKCVVAGREHHAVKREDVQVAEPVKDEVDLLVQNRLLFVVVLVAQAHYFLVCLADFSYQEIQHDDQGHDHVDVPKEPNSVDGNGCCFL